MLSDQNEEVIRGMSSKQTKTIVRVLAGLLVAGLLASIVIPVFFL